MAAGELARLRVERTEPLIAVGGGALGDAAGFLAATWLRGVPLIHVPTTLVAQIDSSIGGKTAVDLAEGKNLVGAFHQPAAILIDVALVAGLPERQRRSALGEAVKMAALGDDALFALLERDGGGIVRADPAVIAHGAVAELVERCAWAKVEVVLADERESGGRAGASADPVGVRPDRGRTAGAQPRPFARPRLRGRRRLRRRPPPWRGGGPWPAGGLPDRRCARRHAGRSGRSDRAPPDHARPGAGRWVARAGPRSGGRPPGARRRQEACRRAAALGPAHGRLRRGSNRRAGRADRASHR